MVELLRALRWHLHHWDVALSYRWALRREPATRPAGYWFARLCAHMGDGWLWGLVAWLLWRRWNTGGDSAADGVNRRWMLAAWVVNMLATAGLTLWIKHHIRRPRPGVARLMYGRGPDIHSFPSGHAARLGTISVWASSLLPGWGRLAWPLAALIGWSRVRLGIHYVGDVFAGFLLGAGLAWLFRRHLPSLPIFRRIG
ncbi:phosphatase PAP2 family protein [Litorilinea aerophila]|uniref:Phosphatase PAP2 family protein n=1 Tax=Litorilinea aerophila TaxID=1204385 RepID=A0A540VHC2_9CHLR|nr:phosphatase PAP2 family protein [Litorilinea aerophila]MCC9076201.1 phosphatase PAP2 family protein [Litorilinea aerophila]